MSTQNIVLHAKQTQQTVCSVPASNGKFAKYAMPLLEYRQLWRALCVFLLIANGTVLGVPTTVSINPTAAAKKQGYRLVRLAQTQQRSNSWIMRQDICWQAKVLMHSTRVDLL
jgi:hypothetical protein